MNINVDDYLMAIDEINLYDMYWLENEKEENWVFDIKPFEIFEIYKIYNDDWYLIYMFDKEKNDFAKYYIKKEDLKGRSVKLKVEEI